MLGRIPAVSILYRRLRDDALLKREPAATPMGFKFIGVEAMERGTFEPEETALFKLLVAEADALVNVGANVGYYVCFALQAGRRAYAFEPMETNVQTLLRNVRANGWAGEAEVFPLALGDRPGIVEIFGSGTGASLVKGWAGVSEKHVTLVPCNALDAVLGDRLAGRRLLVLVDIEGAERAMLEGATTLLEMEPRPTWMVEISVAEHQPHGVPINPHLAATFALFFDRGYSAYTADRAVRPVEREEVETVARTGVDTLRTHNFLFVAPGTDVARLRQA